MAALKTYQKQTLNDSWFEERAEPLNGVLVDFGETLYESTSKSHFMKPQNWLGYRGITRAEKKKLMTERNKTQKRLFCQQFIMDGRNENLICKEIEMSHNAPITSTYRESYKADHFQPCDNKNNMTIYGGGGGPKIEHGKAASGASGEVFKDLPEPKQNTAVQRSWMYSMDPMIAAKVQNSKQCANSKDYNGNQLSDETIKCNNRTNFRKISTSITTLSRKQNGIFKDDVIE